MIKMLKDFWKNLKEYIKVIFKLDFGELFVYILEMILTMVVGILTYYPVKLIRDLFVSIITLCGFTSGIAISVLDIIFNILTIICFVCTFIYCFNIRYGELKQSEKEKKQNKEKEDNNIELPSIKK